MTDFAFNISKGSVHEKVRDGALVKLLLLKSGVEGDGVLADYDTVSALLVANPEADFTNYERKTIGDIAVVVDNANDRSDVTGGNQTWMLAGGVANNDLAKVVTYEDVDGTDASAIPLTCHNFLASTAGIDLVLNWVDGYIIRVS